MLKTCIRTINSSSLSVFTKALSSVAPKEKWDILTAVCVERKPMITPQMTELQEKFQEQLYRIELANSSKSEHEVRHEQDLKHLEQLKKGTLDVDLAMKQTAQDFLDSSIDELKKFKSAPRTSELDMKSDYKSLDRLYEKHLVLLVKHKIADKEFYLLPQGIRNDGETLRQTAERILKDQIGSQVKASIYGNAPVGFYKYKYPKKVRSDAASVGAKVFIYFARYKSGQLDGKINHKWLNRDELKEELPEKYHKSVEMFLIDE